MVNFGIFGMKPEKFQIFGTRINVKAFAEMRTLFICSKGIFSQPRKADNVSPLFLL